jgi:hypothetical protein
MYKFGPRKRGNWKLKKEALFGTLALEEAMDM